MIERVLTKLLLASAEVTNRVGAYPLTPAGTTMPAIFTSDVEPVNPVYPSVRVLRSGGDDWGCRAQRGQDAAVDIRVFDNRLTDSSALRELADIIWGVVNRADLKTLLALEGYESWGCRAEPPQYIPDEDGYPGYLILVRARVLENAP